MRLWIKRIAAAAAAFSLHWGAALAQSEVTVFAAASLKNALDAIVADYGRETGTPIVVSYAASSALARQIELGAPAGIFISADLEWMDYLQRRNLIKPGTRRNLVGNRIVLVAPHDEAKPVALTSGALSTALGNGRLAVGNVDTVPAGKYAKAALENLGLWGEVSNRLAQAENVRAALAFVSRGEAPLGIVYETDAKADPTVTIVARFPDTSHPPIVYPAALTSTATGMAAQRFLDALQDEKSAAIFAREGFSTLDR